MSEAPVSLQTSGSLLGYQTGHQNKQEQMQKPLSLNSLKMKKDGKKKNSNYLKFLCLVIRMAGEQRRVGGAYMGT